MGTESSRSHGISNAKAGDSLLADSYEGVSLMIYPHFYTFLNSFRLLTFRVNYLNYEGVQQTNVAKAKKKKKTKNRKRMSGVKLGNVTRSSEDNLEVRIIMAVSTNQTIN